MPKLCKILLVLLLAFSVERAAFSCGEACSDDDDCPSDCSHCDTDFGVCQNCCEFTEQVICGTGCTWTSGECQNDDADSCPFTIPEMPQEKSSRLWILFAEAAALLGIAYLFKRRFRRAK